MWKIVLSLSIMKTSFFPLINIMYLREERMSHYEVVITRWHFACAGHCVRNRLSMGCYALPSKPMYLFGVQALLTMFYYRLWV